MLHYLYQTTNLINGKIYIGVHSTENENDSYLGSGKALLRAIEKYGKSNFKREILEFFETKELMYIREREVVDQAFVNREDTYNMTRGGLGAYKGRPSWWRGKEQWWSSSGFTGCKRSEEWKQKQAEVPKRMKWCTNGERNLYIKKEEDVPEGFRLGRTRTEEQNKKMIETLKRRRESMTEDEHLRMLEGHRRGGDKLRGIRKSAETRKKISETLKKRRENETTCNDSETI